MRAWTTNRMDTVPAPLSESPAYPHLSDDHLAVMRSYGQAQAVHRGELLYRAGEAETDLVLVDSGAVDILAAAPPDSPEVLITQHTSGRFLGELSILTGQFSYLIARVSEPGQVHRILPDQFRRLMAENGELAGIILAAFQARRTLARVVASHSLEILGRDNSAASFAVRRFAERLDIPHLWVDAESVAGVAMMHSGSVVADDLPVAFLPGGSIRNATPRRLAERLGLSYRNRDKSVDLVVVGAGPAGLAATVSGASEGLSTVLLDAISPGGQAASSSRIENYPGFPDGIPGAELTKLAAVQAMKFGAHLYSPCEVVHLDTSSARPRILISDGTEIESAAVVLATGARSRGLPLAGWGAYEGAGIYYAATVLEAASCAGRAVTVVGGANSAGQAALFLAAHNCRVSLVVRGDDVGWGMSNYLIERLLADSLVRVLTSTELVAVRGNSALNAVTLRNNVTGIISDTASCALFCFIGATPATTWLDGIALDDHDFVLTDVNLDLDAVARVAQFGGGRPLPFETSAASVFAAGDVRHGSIKRIAAAVGEGASAVASVHQAIAARR